MKSFSDKRNSILYFFHLKKKPTIPTDSNNENQTLDDFLRKNTSQTMIELSNKKEKPKEEINKTSETNVELKEISKPVKYIKYKLPPLSTLTPYKVHASRKVNEETAKIKGWSLVDILNRFEYKSELIDINVGPALTAFELRVDTGINIRDIYSLSDNIKMELAAREIQIEAPIPGRNTIGIKIPNVERETVCLSELVRQFPSDKKDSKLLFVLGKNTLGKPVFCELNKMPHMLIAGSTGSGKSVCISAIISTILLRTKPDEVKLILIDPKKVEFIPYRDVPHLLMPVITDTAESIFVLKRMCAIMIERFSLLSEVGARDIESYDKKVDENNKNPENPKIYKMPYIVTIIDGYSELAMHNDDEFLSSINRMTEYGRSVGIHLIISMQRPSYKLIDGVAKNNIPSRISFAMSSSIDSQTVLGTSGAEKLTGEGDMMFISNSQDIPTRIHGVYISDEEIKNIANFCKSQGFIPQYDDAYFKFKNIRSGGQSVSEYGRSGSCTKSNKDALYEEVKQYVIQQQKASTSLVQRRFGVGVNRAGTIINMLEEEGIIGPANGSKPREVYFK